MINKIRIYFLKRKIEKIKYVLYMATETYNYLLKYTIPGQPNVYYSSIATQLREQKHISLKYTYILKKLEEKLVYLQKKKEKL